MLDRLAHCTAQGCQQDVHTATQQLRRIGRELIDLGTHAWGDWQRDALFP